MPDYTFYVGQGADVNVVIQIDNGDVSPPKLRYNSSLNRWEVSDDGTTFYAIAAASSGADVTWSSPFRIGVLYIWTDTTVSPNVLRYKSTAPTSESDGTELLGATSGGTL